MEHSTLLLHSNCGGKAAKNNVFFVLLGHIEFRVTVVILDKLQQEKTTLFKLYESFNQMKRFVLGILEKFFSKK